MVVDFFGVCGVVVVVDEQVEVGVQGLVVDMLFVQQVGVVLLVDVFQLFVLQVQLGVFVVEVVFGVGVVEIV